MMHNDDNRPFVTFFTAQVLYLRHSSCNLRLFDYAT